MQWTDFSPTPNTILPEFPPFLSSALVRRGITTMEAARKYLDPSLYSPTPASSIPGVDRAVERILSAIKGREKIFIWGDFDVDGQTATTLLVQSLLSMGAEVSYHIPIRASESHGVNIPFLKDAIDKGNQLIITCDTGITATEAVEYARSRGVDMIITDHHDLPKSLPNAFVVVNPKMLPTGHPLSSLAGVGVVYKLMESIISLQDSETTVSDLEDLAALGLIADLAPLTGDTRFITQKGLLALRQTKRLGLKKLYEMAEIQPEHINESHVGFVIGPRLNALGRLGDANTIVEFLLTTDNQFANVMALQLENYNAQRQLLTSQVTQAAITLLQAEPAKLEAPVIIVTHPSWPGGILGIAAARLVEKFRKPAIVFTSPPGEPAFGSARSVEGVNITEAISHQSDLLINFGGHPMAAGLSLPAERLPLFSKRLMQTVEPMWESTEMKEQSLIIDSWITLPEVTFELADTIEQISPFGPGNPNIVLACRNLILEKHKTIGRNDDHTLLTVVDQSGNSGKVVWWNRGSEEIPQGRFDLAFSLRCSDWHGTPQLQMEFLTYRPHEGEEITVQRGKIKVVDFRSEDDPNSLLRKAHQNPSALIWAEGKEKAEVGGKDRCELVQSDTLIIWSTPPSMADLRFVVEKSKPKTIWLVCQPHMNDTFDDFVRELAGMIKFALSHHDGLINSLQLAAACGQCMESVREGVAWMAASGMIVIEKTEAEYIQLSNQTKNMDSSQAAQSRKSLTDLLAETAAFRAYFKMADKDTLFS